MHPLRYPAMQGKLGPTPHYCRNASYLDEVDVRERESVPLRILAGRGSGLSISTGFAPQ